MAGEKERKETREARGEKRRDAVREERKLRGEEYRIIEEHRRDEDESRR